MAQSERLDFKAPPAVKVRLFKMAYKAGVTASEALRRLIVHPDAPKIIQGDRNEETPL